MRSPLYYCGGKGHIAKWILKYLPPHEVYAEVFAGGCSVFFAKEPAKLEVLNDLWKDLIDFWAVLRDPASFDELQRVLNFTPFSRLEWRRCKELFESGRGGRVERARVFFVLSRQSFSGVFARSWRYVITGVSNAVKSWLSAVNGLVEVHARLRTAQLECLSFEQFIPKYDQPGTVLYLDPPYVADTRVDNRIYVHEMDLEGHQALVQILLEYPQMALLSGYVHNVYLPLEEAHWIRKEIVIATPAKARTRLTGYRGKDAAKHATLRTECLWINPQAQEALAKGQQKVLFP